MFFSAASIAGAFSGLLAFAISKMDGIGGLEGWRWIFILEGIVTVLVAVMAFFALHDFPETAKFLTEEERAFIVFRLKYQGQVQGKQENRVQVAEAEEFKWKYVVDAFTDWQIWINIFVYWGVRLSLTTTTHEWMLTLVTRSYARSTESAYSSQPSSEISTTRPARRS